MQKLKKTRRKQKNNRNKHKHKQNSSKKTDKNNQKYRISSPRTSANKSHQIFAEVRGLDIVYFCFFSFFLFKMCFFEYFVFFLQMFSPSLFKLLHLQSNNTYKNRKTTEKLEGKHNNIKKKQKSPSRNLRDIYSRSVRGLDIMYFCFFFFCLKCFS